jgi:hypothetical protein
MAFPIGAVIAVVPDIIRAVGGLVGKSGKGKMDPKVRNGGLAALIVYGLTVASQFIPGAPAVPPGLETALSLLIGYIVAWKTAIPKEFIEQYEPTN